MIGRPAARWHGDACVFMETSSVPWKAPQQSSATNRPGAEAAIPTKGPATQYPTRHERDHPPAAHPRHQPGADGHGRDRADRRGEQDESEATVREPGTRFDVRNVRRPRGEEQAVDEENRAHGAPGRGPRDGRLRGPSRRSAYPRRYGRSVPICQRLMSCCPSTASSSSRALAPESSATPPPTAARWWRPCGSRSTASDLVFTTFTDNAKARAMRRDPRVVMLVDLEEPPYALRAGSGHRRTRRRRRRSHAGSRRSSAAATWAPSAPRSSASATASPAS